MSKIDEIRKRHQGRTQQLARLGPVAQYEATAEQAHLDRATLLAALDGEWQGERPESGDWWLSIHPSNREGCKRLVYEVTVLGSGEVVMRTGLTHLLFEEIFIGAKWQRRTVPSDPFAGGGE